jgi:uncharacterized protein
MTLQSNDSLFKNFKVRHLILIYILVSVVIAIPMIILTPGSKITESASSVCGYYILSMSAIYLLTTWRLKRVGIDERKIVGRFSWPVKWKKMSIIWLADLVFSVGCIFTILFVASYLFPSYFQSVLEGGIPEPTSLFEQVLYFLVSVVVAPITEEFIFRGIILNRWREKWNTKTALIASSLLFGILHNVGFFGASMFGMISGSLYLRTGSLWTSILYHASHNGTIFIIGLIETLFSSDSNKSNTLNINEVRSYGWIGIVLVLVTLPILLRFIKQTFSKSDSQLSS